MLLIDLPTINPIAIQLGPISVHWYGIMYLLGFILVYVSLLRSSTPLKKTDLVADYIFWAALGVILGGRLGYVLFYNLPYYIQHPIEIIAIWAGGMSFHGGLLGVVVATYVWTKIHKKIISFWQLTDGIVLVIPFTLALGRIGNFINGELYGRLSSLPWAIHFATASGYRHPAQLYEAILHIITGTLLVLTRKTPTKIGTRSALFLIAYGIIRILVEFFREPDAQIGFIAGSFTLGQLLTLPILLAGFWLLFKNSLKSRRS